MDDLIKNRPFHRVDDGSDESDESTERSSESESDESSGNVKTVFFQLNDNVSANDLEQWCSDLVKYIVENCDPIPHDLDISNISPL